MTTTIATALRSLAIFLIAGSFTVIGSLQNMRDGLSFDVQVKQYGWCRRLFEQEEVTAPTDADAEAPEAIRRRYAELGRFALEEQSAWLLFHRLRPLEHA